MSQIREYAISDPVRREVSRLMTIDQKDVIDYGFDVEPTKVMNAFKEKAEILYSSIFEDKIDVNQAVRLSVQHRELAARNVMQSMQDSGLPGPPVSINEAHKAIAFDFFPDWVNVEYDKREALRDEKRDLARGDPHGTASITPIAKEIEKAQHVSTETPSPSSSEPSIKRRLDSLRQIERGNTTVYKSPLLSRTLIESTEKQLTVHGASHLAAESAIDIADDRGWSSISVTGSRSTRQALWIAGSSRGIEVKGYEPTVEDQQLIANLYTPRATVESIKTNVVDLPTRKSTPDVSDTAATPTDKNNNGVYKGKLIEHGQDNYRHDAGEKGSYYAKIETDDGKQVELWGKDIERAINTAGATPLDRISLSVTDRKPVNVPVAQKDKEGHTIGTTTKTVKLNTWNVTVEKKHKIIERETSRQQSAGIER